jgi:hypothetical protein
MSYYYFPIPHANNCQNSNCFYLENSSQLGNEFIFEKLNIPNLKPLLLKSSIIYTKIITGLEILNILGYKKWIYAIKY